MFFQVLLLAGYLYSHIVTTKLSLKAQVVLHCGLLVAAYVSLPIPVDVGAPPGGGSPTAWLLSTLVITVGLPFFTVSTTGPLLQRWFSLAGARQSSDPYFLYGASNAGSVAGLLAYPLLLETYLGRQQQVEAWRIGFIVFGVLTISAAILAVKSMRKRGERAEHAVSAASSAAQGSVTTRQVFRWVALAFVPSSLMLGVTQHLSTDVAAIPMLWIIPLSIYLVSFIVAFARKWRLNGLKLGRALPFGVIAVTVVMLTQARSPMLVIATIHLITFASAALMCHTVLADERPDTRRLTLFYLCISAGGAAGGAFNALVAPVVFNNVYEYPLVLGLACLLRPQMVSDLKRVLNAAGESLRPVRKAVLAYWLRSLIAAGLALSLLLLCRALVNQTGLKGTIASSIKVGVPMAACFALLLGAGSLRFGLAMTGVLVLSLATESTARRLHLERTFFGVHEVTTNKSGNWHVLSHGTTLHGIQARFDTRSHLAKNLYRSHGGVVDESMPRLPTTYYHPSGPAGDVMRMLNEGGRLRDAAFVGLGCGSMAAYAQPGSRFTFYEIDPAVIRIAQNKELFSFVSDALSDPTVSIRFVVGDGRVQLQRDAPEGAFDVIVLDAFSSDAIPVHLLTREAIEMYVSRLKKGGVLAVHISNRYFDLGPVLAAAADELRLVAFLRNDNAMTTTEQTLENKRDSNWVVMAREAADLGWLAKVPNWQPMKATPGFRVWTDEYNNLLGVFRDR